MKYRYNCLLLPLLFVAITSSFLMAQPTVSFSNSSGGSIQEGVGPANLFVNIMNPNGNPTTVQVTHSGSATYGVDYTISPDTVVFPGGSSASQPVTITLIDDCMDEGFETIVLMLVNPTNGAQINIGTITITISDNDPALVEDCTYTVPANAIVVDTTMSFFNHNRDFWVCESGNLRLPSNLHTALVENGGVLRSEGDDNEIFVKNGGTVIVEDGDQNQIFAESGATVTIESGSCNVVFLADGAIFTDNGTETFEEELTCAPLNINYSSAPVNGCLLSAVNFSKEDFNIDVFPNPTKGNFEIRHAENQSLRYIELYDIRGSFLGEIPVNDKKLPETQGIYIVRLVFEKGVVIQHLVKN